MDNQTLLITGGTGSFGKTVLDYFLKTNIKEIRVFSRDEEKQEIIRNHYNHQKLKFYLGDIRDLSSISQAMIGVNYVFHAAALKQVPSCEFYPMQAVKTNIIGTDNVLEAAQLNQIKSVVLLSTDKAVHPVNAMGMSKAMMEKLMIARSRDIAQDRVICATRYGNVMASRGSVIPLFIKQIKSGQPITITNPNMTRFMMSLTESMELVNFAFHNAQPGDIFVQKSPATTVEILANALKEIFNVNNEIRIIGTRHGEKLYETLLTKEELSVAKDMGGYYRVPADNRTLNYSQYITQGTITMPEEDYHSHNAKRLDLEDTQEILLQLSYIKQQLKSI